jgi:hypothetical protein
MVGAGQIKMTTYHPVDIRKKNKGNKKNKQISE